MTDVQMNNARRVGFTALALVLFWLLAWRGYLFVYDCVLNGQTWILEALSEFVPRLGRTWMMLALFSFSFALIPTILCSIATHGFVLRLRDRWLLVVGTLFATSLGLSLWVGMIDIRAAAKALPHDPVQNLYSPLTLARDRLEVSWLVLLPIILTTAFVIFGAWRQAVRDAAVVVAEDNDE